LVSEPQEEAMTTGTSIDDLARTLADHHGIDTHAAAVDTVRVHVDEIRDDPELWDTATRTLTSAGVEVITRAVDASYSVGAVATAAAQVLVELEEVTSEIGRLTARREVLVRTAMRRHELRRDDIAAAAGVTPARLYQIRDGRR